MTTNWTSDLPTSFDVVVCGSGPAGLAVAGRLTENPDLRVLLVEAGGDEDHPDIRTAANWRANLGSEREWGFRSEPNPGLDGRSIALSMGRVVGGGSSINVMGWARGHRADWDGFADAGGEQAWRADDIEALFDRLERFEAPGGSAGSGRIFVRSAETSDTTAATLEAFRLQGIPTFDRLNGPLWRSDAGGASLWEWRNRDGRRLSLAADYLDRSEARANLTFLRGCAVRRVRFEEGRAVGVELAEGGRTHLVRAELEVVLSMGAVNTPRTLMLSGVGDADELRPLGIEVQRHLPGVGRNLQDHLLVGGFIWERADTSAPARYGAVVDAFARVRGSSTPNVKCSQIDGAFPTPGQDRAALPGSVLTLLPALVRPESRGRVRLLSADPDAEGSISTDYLGRAEDLAALLAAVEIAREVAASSALRPYLGRELFTGHLRGDDLAAHVRASASTYWHYGCTAAMGRDEGSVVDGRLRVHGLEALRVAAASAMPRVPISLPMAPCVAIGERAADFIQRAHGV